MAIHSYSVPPLDFVWPFGGKNVKLALSSKNFEPFEMIHDGKVWKHAMPPYEYQNLTKLDYKFVVDDKWCYDITKPNHFDEGGNVNNYIRTDPYFSNVGTDTHVSAAKLTPNVLVSNNSVAFTAKGTNFIDPESDLFYFEVTVLASEPNPVVGVGLVTDQFQDVGNMPGWEFGYGFHCDDGLLFNYGDYDSTNAGPTWQSPGDVAGFAYLPKKKKIVVVLPKKNFVKLAFSNVEEQKYRYAVGIEGHGSALVNLGQSEFVFKDYKKLLEDY